MHGQHIFGFGGLIQNVLQARLSQFQILQARIEIGVLAGDILTGDVIGGDIQIAVGDQGFNAVAGFGEALGGNADGHGGGGDFFAVIGGVLVQIGIDDEAAHFLGHFGDLVHGQSGIFDHDGHVGVHDDDAFHRGALHINGVGGFAFVGSGFFHLRSRSGGRGWGKAHAWFGHVGGRGACSR